MAVLKWIVIVLAAIYLVGVAVLYFRQREMLFPIPPVGRTAPGDAGLPDRLTAFGKCELAATCTNRKRTKDR